MPSPSPTIRTVRTYQITNPSNPNVPRRIHLTPWDLAMLSVHYIQKGLLFANVPSSTLSVRQIIEQLVDSLKEALFHFYPLSGRLKVTCEGRSTSVEVACDGEEGAELVHAVAEGVTVADVVALDGGDLPEFLKEFFQLDLAVNFDGCCKPLLAIQVTELVDGVFVGCSLNHAIGDGTSFWHFFNAWAEISRAKANGEEYVLSRPPVHDRWFIDGYGENIPPIKLPYTSPTQFVVRFTPPLLRERMFHFSVDSIAKLKVRANKECGKGIISSFQALSALMWRVITRARRLPPQQETGCRLAIQNRWRLQPQLSPDYFGNSIYAIGATTTAGELLDHDLGWAAWLLNQLVAEHTDASIKKKLNSWMERPAIYGLNMFDIHSIMMGSSPRFDKYGCDFGWGKPVVARSGSAHKFDGKVSAYPGWEGAGSVDLEVCLLPEYMSALLKDEEFLAAVSSPVKLEVMLSTCNK